MRVLGHRLDGDATHLVERLADLFPDGRFRTLPGGHFFPQETHAAASLAAKSTHLKWRIGGCSGGLDRESER